MPRHWFFVERAKARTALARIACLIATGCAATAAPDASPDSSAAPKAGSTESAAAAATAAASSAPGPSATPSGAPLSEEERERQNEGCKYRKSTNKVSQCEAVKKGPLSAKDLSEAIRLSKDACYCVKDLPALVDQCMTQAGSGSVKLTVGTLDDPTDCTLTITSSEASGRRFARFKADVRDVATFYATISVHEVRNGKTERLYDGFNDIDPAELKGWDKLPAAIKTWVKGE